MKFRFFLLAVLCLIALTTERRVRADGVIRDGIGAISTSRGGTNIAHSDNGAVLLDNPAGLANFGGERFFELGFDTLITDLDYYDADPNNVNGEFMALPLPQVSWFQRSAGGDWVYGIGLFIPAGFTAEYEMTHPLLGPQEYRSLGALVKILPAVAYQVTDRLSIGASLGAAISHVQLEGPYTGQTLPLQNVPTVMDLDLWGAAPTFSVGAQFQLTSQTTIGLSYQSESRFTLSGDATVDAFMPGRVTSDFDVEMDKVWPRSLGLGVAHWATERQRVSADVIWFDWSSAFDTFDFRFNGATNPTLQPFGEIRDTLPLNWHDSVSLRLGYEFFTYRNNVWRAGYVYHRSPVPSTTLNPYLDGVLEHAFSIGHSRQWRCWQLNLAYQYSFGPERHVGQSDILGGDFDNSEFRAQAHWTMFSLLRRF